MEKRIKKYQRATVQRDNETDKKQLERKMLSKSLIRVITGMAIAFFVIPVGYIIYLVVSIVIMLQPTPAPTDKQMIEYFMQNEQSFNRLLYLTISLLLQWHVQRLCICF